MTQEEYKDLLLKDICARFPYGVQCKIYDYPELYYLSGVTHVGCYFNFGSVFESLEDIKPYLRPMSSMTEKEVDEFTQFDVYSESEYIMPNSEAIDWLNAHHFDYHNLIERGLAIEAPKDLYEID